MWNNKGDFLLCICCLTYNQSNYIKDTLDGFCMQQTTFPFYAVVFDDASTDGEQEVIKGYLDEHFEQSEGSGYQQWETEDAFFAFARHKENESCHFLVVYQKKNLYQTPRKDELIAEWCVAKYIAFCEGDDYWTYPLKLQKQVGFLEEHEEFVVCASRHSVFFEDEKRMGDHDQFEHLLQKGQDGLELTVDNYFQIGVLPQMLTLVYRFGILKKSEWFNKLKNRSKYDQTMLFSFVEFGKIWVMNENMGVYRRHIGGVATSLSRKQAAEKMYYTWRDVYEVHPIEVVKDLYVTNLKHYYYYLVKHGANLFGEEVRALKKEYKVLDEPLKNRICFFGRLLKGMALRSFSKEKNE